MKQALVILRGAPASGKSTLGKRLRSKENNVVWLKIDNLKLFFSDTPEDSMDEVNSIALVITEKLLSDGFSVVLDGIFKNPDHAREAIQLAEMKNIPIAVYQLTCSLDTLMKREYERSEKFKRNHFEKDMIERLYLMVINNPIEDAITLDTEKLSINECYEIINRNFV